MMSKRSQKKILCLRGVVLSGQACLWSTWEHPSVLASAAQQILPVRYKKRIKYRPRPKSKKKAKRKPIPVAIRSDNKILAKEDDPVLMARVPEDDVWIAKYYPDPKLKLSEALEWMREAACPEMEDNLQELVWFKCRLDMSTKKKTKFRSGFTTTEVVPHLFDDGSVNKIIALCKTEEDREAARQAGAELVGGLDLVHTISNREINIKEYDRVVSSLDMASEIASIRKYLKDLFPSRPKGTIDEDVGAMVHRFTQGKEVTATKDDANVGHVEVPIGQLDMDDDKLRENLQFFVDTICKYKRNPVGPYIRRGFLVCPPSSYAVELDSSELEPTANEDSKVQEPEEEEDVLEAL